VVKKKKGPKKGTKYKKRATAAPDAGGGLAPKYPKMTKKAAAAAAAAVAAAAASSRTMAHAFGRFGLQNTQVDLGKHFLCESLNISASFCPLQLRPHTFTSYRYT